MKLEHVHLREREIKRDKRGRKIIAAMIAMGKAILESEQEKARIRRQRVNDDHGLNQLARTQYYRNGIDIYASSSEVWAEPINPEQCACYRCTELRVWRRRNEEFPPRMGEINQFTLQPIQWVINPRWR